MLKVEINKLKKEIYPKLPHDRQLRPKPRVQMARVQLRAGSRVQGQSHFYREDTTRSGSRPLPIPAIVLFSANPCLQLRGSAVYPVQARDVSRACTGYTAE